jgi:hypothetical protein
MKAFGMVLLCLALGACASFISMLMLTTPEHQGGGSWDYRPIFGAVFGLPTWLVSFPVIYFFSRSKAQSELSAFAFASLGAFVLTIVVPLTLHRLGFP